jgi:hypothetical protein
MAGIGSIISILGTVVSAAGTLAAGAARKRAADYQAARDEVRAGEAKAEAQRDAQKISRKRGLALSRMQSLSAASGFSPGDPTSLMLASERDAYGRYDQQIAQYGGDVRQSNFKNSATASRMSNSATD